MAQAGPPSVDTDARIVAIVQECRELLRDFAETECDSSRPPRRATTMKPWEKAGELGDIDGVGTMLRAASIRIEPDGTITAEERARFFAEGEAHMDAMQAQFSNFVVMFAIFLTITTALLTLNVGIHMYPSDTGEVAQLGSVFGYGDVETSLAFSDFAAYAWPNDVDAQGSLRRALSIAEAAVLTAALGFQMWGLNVAFALSTAFGPALPTVIAKYEMVLDRPKRLLEMYGYVMSSQLFMLFALPLILARATAVLAMAAFCIDVVALPLLIHSMRHGVYGAVLLMQHREARLLLGYPLTDPRKGTTGDAEG